MIRAGLVCLVVALAGCSTPHALEDRWRPLAAVVERPDLLLSGSAATALGTRVYVADLPGWLRRFPPGSAEYEALLLHEREHSRRQLDAGLGEWLARYLSDPDFAWREEQRGWYLQLKALQAAGRPLVPAVIAAALSDYRVLGGSLVSYADAFAWVHDVLAGRWTPDELEASGG